MDESNSAPGISPESLEPAEPALGGNVFRPSAPPRSTWHRIFVGPAGIRAGWRLLLFLLVALIFAAPLLKLARLLERRLQQGFTPLRILLEEGILFLAILCSALVMGRIERRSLSDYALPRRGAFGRQFWLGVVWGFFALTGLLLTLRAGHAFSFGSLALGGSGLVFDAALWAMAFLCVGFFEEFLMRGYALYTLSTGMGFWPAAALLSAVFGAVHLRNPGENWMGALSAVLIGVFFSLTVRRTGSLWFAIGMHSMWDYSESFVYSVPDSGAMVEGHLLNSSFHGPRWLTGGSVGPEGSALVFVVIAVIFVLFDRLHREVRLPRVGPSQPFPN